MKEQASHRFSWITRLRLITLIICLMTAPILYGQQRLFTNQQHFGVEEGLPQSFISNIVQDDDGFIWMSTLDGICRYDGRGFKTFRHNPADSTSIATNVINNMERQRNNTISIVYSNQETDDFDLYSFKASRNRMRDRLNNIRDANWNTGRLGKTSNNYLFLVKNHKGLGWLDGKTGKTHYASKANGLLQTDTISAAVESAAGKLYLLSENGVHISDTGRKTFAWIPFPTKIKATDPVGIVPELSGKFSIVWLKDNQLAVATFNELILLDVDKKTSRQIEVPAAAAGAAVPMMSDLSVDPRGRLYFVHGGRVFRVNEAGELKMLWQNVSHPQLRISGLFIDRSDVLWLSVNAQGLLKIDLQASLFESYAYQHGFIIDILTHVGVNHLAIPTAKTTAETSLSFRHAKDSKGNLYFTANWFGENKIYVFNKTGLSYLPRLPFNTNYTAVLVMPNDEIWAFDHHSVSWYVWQNANAIPQKLEPGKELLRPAEIADAKFMNGDIWIATESSGLLQYQGTKNIKKMSGNSANGVMPEPLTQICADPFDKNKFWIGSRGSGLILWDLQKGLQRIYTTADGLPNNTIYCILPDKTGKLWCSSNKGIFRFDGVTGQVTAFEKTDGLPGNEFNRSHKFAFDDGRLAFGGIDGYTIFHPADFNFNKQKADFQLKLTTLQINNQLQDMGLPNSFIREPLSRLSSIELPHHKNYLRFEFAALLFNQPQKIKYRYQLKGTDEDWIENGTSNIAAYSALRPGNYIFRINSTDHNGQWSETIKEIKVIIHPPFWATWWAYLIYALIAVGLIRWYFKFREKQLKSKQELAFEKREALRLKEVDELKDRFFSNITHEFRTPLTLIMTPLEKLEHDPSLSTAAVNSVKTAQRNSQQLLKLINQFLDFSKLNDGQLKLKLSSGELKLFVEENVRAFENAANEKNIDLQFSSTGIEGYYVFDEEKWEKIINNLLSNAMKFTQTGGAVDVSLNEAANDQIELVVKDSGEGIPMDQQKKIFDRFYQVDDSSTRNIGGTGIGLSLVKELAELMHGNIKLESKPGHTVFTVTIPVQRSIAIQAAEELVPGSSNKPTVAVKENDAPLLLIVEDNDELRSFLVETMQQHYRVLEAADGISAWEIILKELPDMLISDVMMPGRDGFDLCKLCKEDQRTAHIGFILLTSKAAHDARIKGLGTGADDYITKPFNLQELELRTANLFQLQQKQRAWLQSQLVASSPQPEPPVLTDPFLIQLYQEMDAKLDDQELGVDYLARAMAMSRSTLNRKLKSLLDTSTNELIRQYRLQKATTLLSSGVDISTVAYQVGFSSPSYFTQSFKEKYGITPSDWVSSQP